MTPSLRSYDPDGDRPGLWSLKRAFEIDVAGGDDAKADAYAAKLDADYRESYLGWVADCVAREPDCVVLAVVDAHPDERDELQRDVAATGDGATPVGFAFVLPEAFAHVWDAAVLNELYVAPARRGSGLADDLMAAALEHARGQDLPMDRMVLDVDPDNERASAFYRGHGFESWAEMVAREL